VGVSRVAKAAKAEVNTSRVCLSSPRDLKLSEQAHLLSASNGTLPKHIFTFWAELPLPELAAACVASFVYHNPGWQVHLLTLANVNEYDLNPPPGEGIWDDQYHIPQHLADWYRLQAVVRYGGVWMDATVVMLAPVTDWVHAGDRALTGFYSPWATSLWTEERSMVEMDMENSIFSAPAGYSLVRQWRNNFASAFKMGFSAYAASQPLTITGDNLLGDSGTYMAAYIALRQAITQLNATWHIEDGITPRARSERALTDGRISGTPNVRLMPSILGHGPYQWEMPFLDPESGDWTDCDAVDAILECPTRVAEHNLSTTYCDGCVSCADLLDGTPLLKFRFSARECFPLLAGIRPGAPSFLRNLLVEGLHNCVDPALLDVAPNQIAETTTMIEPGTQIVICIVTLGGALLAVGVWFAASHWCRKRVEPAVSGQAASAKEGTPLIK